MVTTCGASQTLGRRDQSEHAAAAGTLNNIEAVGFPKCLTGPIARGDVATIGRHLAALEKVAPQMVPLYRELGLFTVPIGQDKGNPRRGQGAGVENTFERWEKLTPC